MVVNGYDYKCYALLLKLLKYYCVKYNNTIM